MSKISLKHSGGNVVSLNSPTNAPTSSDVAFKLPNADGTSGQVLKTDGSGNLSFAGTGKILQVKQVVKTDTFTSSVNGTDITGLSVTMDAPASSSSKYLIFANVPVMGSNYGGGIRLNGTTNGVLLQPTSYGSRTPVSGAEAYQSNNQKNHVDALCFLDSPSTSNAQTYKVQVVTAGATIKINRLNVDTDSSSYSRGCATLTVMEVAA